MHDPDAAHVASHLGLLRQVPGSEQTGQRFDAVIVPTARRADGLATAVHAAEEHARFLVVLCSKGCRGWAVERLLQQLMPEIPVLVIGMDGYQPPIRFDCDAEAAPIRKKNPPDTAVKRNVGLALARYMGWGPILFLDDDVQPPPDREVQSALAAVGVEQPRSFAAVGWNFEHFPDNSAACHAYREVGEKEHGPQETFVGGGGLVVDARSEHLTFFPDIYNEDWFFLVDALTERRVAWGGTLLQDDYEPFLHPSTAALQEFGDLVGEGVFRLLHDHPGSSALLEAQEIDYWHLAVERRRRFLADVHARTPRGSSMSLSLAMARRTYETAGCGPDGYTKKAVRWVEAWRRDLERWEGLMEMLHSSRGESHDVAALFPFLKGMGLNLRWHLHLPDRAPVVHSWLESPIE